MNLLNRIIIWVRHNKGISVSAVVLIIMGVPVLIHIAYKIPSPSWLASEWSAGEMLSYYGAVLGFLGTVIFSALALLQNEIIKEEADKNQRMQEEMERKRVEPRFHIIFTHRSGPRMSVAIENTSGGRVYGVAICNTKIIRSDGNISDFIYKNEIGVINAGERITRDLIMPEINQNQHVEFQIKCKDIYDKLHTFKGKCFESGKELKFIINKDID